MKTQLLATKLSDVATKLSDVATKLSDVINLAHFKLMHHTRPLYSLILMCPRNPQQKINEKLSTIQYNIVFSLLTSFILYMTFKFLCKSLNLHYSSVELISSKNVA